MKVQVNLCHRINKQFLESQKSGICVMFRCKVALQCSILLEYTFYSSIQAEPPVSVTGVTEVTINRQIGISLGAFVEPVEYIYNQVITLNPVTLSKASAALPAVQCDMGIPLYKLLLFWHGYGIPYSLKCCQACSQHSYPMLLTVLLGLRSSCQIYPMLSKMMPCTYLKSALLLGHG